MDSTRNPKVNKIYKQTILSYMRMSNPESNEFSLIKSNIRSYNKILRSLIKETEQCFYMYKPCFQNCKHNIKQSCLSISSITNTKKQTDIPEFFT